MLKSAIFLMLLLFSINTFPQECIGGLWDISSNIWFTDCTGDQYDGRYVNCSLNRAYNPVTVSGDTTITLENDTQQTIYWRLYYFDNIADNSIPVQDSIPLVAGLHCWSNYGSTLDQLLESGNTYLENDPAAVRVISLTFSINISDNNSGTWWWGRNINGVSTPWAEDAIVKIIRKRKQDACQLFANAGISELSGKSIDENRVYLRGHSMGGTGAYRIGIKYPDIFAAVHCHAGFADFKGPNGAFNDGFINMVGTSGEQCIGIDGNSYNALDYTDMSWFVRDHKGESWENLTGNSKKYEPPYICMTHGTNDNAVDIASADRLYNVLDSLKYGYSYFRHTGEHSDNNGTRAHWMFNFRKNQSYLAFTNNSTNTSTNFNFLNKIGWRPSSIIDEVDYYEVQMTGTSGSADVTLRRLQNFNIQPGKSFHYWIGEKTGNGIAVDADENGVLTLPGINAGSKLIIEPDIPTSIEDKNISNNAVTEDFNLSQNYPNPFNPSTMINYQLPMNNMVTLKIFDILGREVITLVNEHKPAGNYTVEWNGTNTSGQQVSGGIYFYQLKTSNGFIETRKMLLIK